MIVGAQRSAGCAGWPWRTARQRLKRTLREEFPAATLRRDPSLSRLVESAVESVSSGTNLLQNQTGTESLDLRGTVFQLRVWKRCGRFRAARLAPTANWLARWATPKPTRAVARACAFNRVAVLVPCHRVVGADGSLTGYRWGVERKRQLLKAETSLRDNLAAWQHAPPRRSNGLPPEAKSSQAIGSRSEKCSNSRHVLRLADAAQRSSGVSLLWKSLPMKPAACVPSVSIRPGLSALTRIPSGRVPSTARR